jgi:hypothetical protein
MQNVPYGKTGLLATGKLLSDLRLRLNIAVQFMCPLVKPESASALT